LPVIWAAISGHGYGHAAQIVPVLNALGRLVPGLTVVLRTTVPESFFRNRLRIPWTLQSVQQDVGCVQRGPLQIDVLATWKAHDDFHAQWDQRMRQEVEAIRSAAPQVIVADTPYLALSAGSEAGVPTVCLATFTWHEILRALAGPSLDSHQPLLGEIEQSYASADSALRIAPGLPLSPIRNVMDVGPIAEPAQPCREAVRKSLGIPDSERLVLIGFGGIPLTSLPWDAMDRMHGYRFIVDEPMPSPSSKILSLQSLPYSFKSLLASDDIVMTKPGYGTIMEAVAAEIPVVYVRRYNFADEQPLVDFLGRYGRSSQLSLEDFHMGRWLPAYEAIQRHRDPLKPPSCTGARDAAAHLAKFF